METQVKHTVAPLRYHDCTRIRSHNTVRTCKLLTRITTGKQGGRGARSVKSVTVLHVVTYQRLFAGSSGGFPCLNHRVPFKAIALNTSELVRVFALDSKIPHFNFIFKNGTGTSQKRTCDCHAVHSFFNNTKSWQDFRWTVYICKRLGYVIFLIIAVVSALFAFNW